MKHQFCCPNTAFLVHDLLDETAARMPNKTAVFTDEESITYSNLSESSCRLAAWFSQIGIRRGDRIALLLPNCIPTITMLMAASRIGAIFFIVNPSTKPYHLRHIMEDAQPSLIVTSHLFGNEAQLSIYARVMMIERDWKQALESEPVSQPFPGISSDPICLIYTSGSTGKPKAVISSHSNMTFAAHAIQQCLSYQEADVVGNFLPMAFDVGLYQALLSFQVGATLALGQDIHVGPGLLKKLTEWKVTGLPAVPSLVSTLIRLGNRTPHQLPPLRFITNTGAHLPHAYISNLRTLFPTCAVFVMFGLTECKRVSILQPSEYERKSESVGKPLPDTECLIVDADNKVLPPGVVGELIVRGPHVMLGYWRASEITAKRFRLWGPGLERVLFTGDACSMDEEGYLYFHGRSDDIYKQRGYRVSALEVEAAACDIAGVRQAALVPPNEEMGAMLFVVGNLVQTAVFNELRTRLEDYKLPTQIILIDELPLTPNGKTDKKQLRTILAEDKCGL